MVVVGGVSEAGRTVLLLFPLSELTADMRSLAKINQNHKNANAVITLPLWDDGILNLANAGKKSSKQQQQQQCSGGDEEPRLGLASVFVSVHALMSGSGAPKNRISK